MMKKSYDRAGLKIRALIVPISALLLAANAMAARTEHWVIDSATGAAVCELDGTAPSGGYSLAIDMQGHGVVMHLAGLPYNNNPDASWSLSLGWPLLKAGTNWRGGQVTTPGSDFPPIMVNGSTLAKPGRQSYRYDGVLNVLYAAQGGVRLTCALFPSPTKRAAIEEWTIENTGASAVTVDVASGTQILSQPTDANSQPSLFERVVAGINSQQVAPGGTISCAILYTLRKASDPSLVINTSVEKAARLALFAKARQTMVLQCPEPILSGTLTLAKMRTLEAPMESRAGLIQTTGGLEYMPGIWANDNVEYASPGCPFLGDPVLNSSCNNMYAVWVQHLLRGETVRGSYETYDMTGCTGGRGDQAMMLYGLSNYLLGLGDADTARKFWPLVQAAAQETKAALNSSGVVTSRRDELEGRYPAGSANLSSSGLAYGGYCAASRLAGALGKPGDATAYNTDATAMANAIESYFGATVEGFQTYKYYDTCTILRGWISVPVTTGIMQRAAGTIAALFSPGLWFESAAAYDAGTRVASTDNGTGGWPRETYYALRAAFRAGYTELALQKTVLAARYAMLGPKGPYMDEDAVDLLSPNALYMRVIPEGLFGIEPRSLDGFACTPRLPAAWPSMRLLNICMMGRYVDVSVSRVGQQIRLTVTKSGVTILSQDGPDGTTFLVNLNGTTPVIKGSRRALPDARFTVNGNRLAVAGTSSQMQKVEVIGLDGRITHRQWVNGDTQLNIGGAGRRGTSVAVIRVGGTAATRVFTTGR